MCRLLKCSKHFYINKADEIKLVLLPKFEMWDDRMSYLSKCSLIEFPVIHFELTNNCLTFKLDYMS
jgi:hypothetical protein